MITQPPIVQRQTAQQDRAFLPDLVCKRALFALSLVAAVCSAAGGCAGDEGGPTANADDASSGAMESKASDDNAAMGAATEVDEDAGPQAPEADVGAVADAAVDAFATGTQGIAADAGTTADARAGGASTGGAQAMGMADVDAGQAVNAARADAGRSTAAMPGDGGRAAPDPLQVLVCAQNYTLCSSLDPLNWEQCVAEAEECGFLTDGSGDCATALVDCALPNLLDIPKNFACVDQWAQCNALSPVQSP